MLDILFQDETLVAVNKPSGILVHSSELAVNETQFVLQILRDQIGQHLYPVHRLDKATSGVLIFALNPQAARQLAGDFESRTIGKHYLAIVRGWPADSGEIDHALKPVADDYLPGNLAKATQPAQTSYATWARTELPWPMDRHATSRYALVSLLPHTGRRHQLRRHLKHISHPIIGDSTYGKGQHNRAFAEAFGANRLLLACEAMTLPHPARGNPLTIRAPLAADFAHVARALGWLSVLAEHEVGWLEPAPAINTRRCIWA